MTKSNTYKNFRTKIYHQPNRVSLILKFMN